MISNDGSEDKFSLFDFVPCAWKRFSMTSSSLHLTALEMMLRIWLKVLGYRIWTSEY